METAHDHLPIQSALACDVASALQRYMRISDGVAENGAEFTALFYPLL